MSYESLDLKQVKGRSLEDCRNQLYQMYGKDYKIVNKKSDFERYGFLGLKERPVTIVYYTPTHSSVYESNSSSSFSFGNRDLEAEQLKKNQQEILNNHKEAVLGGQILELTKKLDQMQNQFEQKMTSIANSATEKHETIRRIEELLQENEFTFSYIEMIEEKIRSAFSLDQLDDYDLVERYVVDWIGESINIAKGKVFRPPHVIIIVGPTGDGKTTTIAKIASNTVIDARKNRTPEPEICILTIDTMRVGALEQLSKFGDILEKTVLKAESAEDVRKIYEENKNHVDYMFIDTSGYSPNDAEHIADMQKILNVQNLNPDVYLSVCATKKASDLKNILRNYEPFGYDSVIVTKCDETKQFGNVISILYENHKSIAYITDGQRVPRNIKRPSVVDFLILLNGFNIDRDHIEEKFGVNK